jgi:hypothetical protein
MTSFLPEISRAKISSMPWEKAMQRKATDGGRPRIGDAQRAMAARQIDYDRLTCASGPPIHLILIRYIFQERAAADASRDRRRSMLPLPATRGVQHPLDPLLLDRRCKERRSSSHHTKLARGAASEATPPVTPRGQIRQ